jgi:hypothetical protein
MRKSPCVARSARNLAIGRVGALVPSRRVREGARVRPGERAGRPGPLVAGIEGAINALPFDAQRQLAHASPWRWVLGIQMIGYKGRSGIALDLARVEVVERLWVVG